MVRDAFRVLSASGQWEQPGRGAGPETTMSVPPVLGRHGRLLQVHFQAKRGLPIHSWYECNDQRVVRPSEKQRASSGSIDLRNGSTPKVKLLRGEDIEREPPLAGTFDPRLSLLARLSIPPEPIRPPLSVPQTSLLLLPPSHHTVPSTVRLLLPLSAVIVSIVFQSSTSTSIQPRLWCNRRPSTALNAHRPPFPSLDWPASHCNDPTAFDNPQLVVLPCTPLSAISVSCR